MYRSFQELGEKEDSARETYAVMEVGTQSQKENLLRTFPLVCVDIYADWCMPCKQTAPDYGVLAQKYNRNGLCILVKEKYETKLTYPVPQGLPTYHFYLFGKRTEDEVVGADLNKVEGLLMKYLEILDNKANMPSPDMYLSSPSASSGGGGGRVVFHTPSGAPSGAPGGHGGSDSSAFGGVGSFPASQSKSSIRTFRK